MAKSDLWQIRTAAMVLATVCGSMQAGTLSTLTGNCNGVVSTITTSRVPQGPFYCLGDVFSGFEFNSGTNFVSGAGALTATVDYNTVYRPDLFPLPPPVSWFLTSTAKPDNYILITGGTGSGYVKMEAGHGMGNYGPFAGSVAGPGCELHCGPDPSGIIFQVPFTFGEPFELEFTTTLVAVGMPSQGEGGFGIQYHARQLGVFDSNNNPVASAVITEVPVPEPSSAMLISAGLLGVMMVLRRRLWLTVIRICVRA